MSETKDSVPSVPPHVVNPATAPGGEVVSPVVQYAIGGGDGRRGSAPASRRESACSQDGGGRPVVQPSSGHTLMSPSTGHYGGLPPLEPTLNPRRGSATGSFGLPVPPEWVKGHGGPEIRRGSGYKTSTLAGSWDKDSPVHNWFGNVMTGALQTQAIPKIPMVDRVRVASVTGDDSMIREPTKEEEVCFCKSLG